MTDFFFFFSKNGEMMKMSEYGNKTLQIKFYKYNFFLELNF